MGRDIKFRYRVQVPEGFDSKGSRVDTVIVTPEQLLAGAPVTLTHSLLKVLSRDECTGLKDKNLIEIFEGDVVNDIRGTWKIAWSVSGFVAVPIKAINRYGPEKQNKPLAYMSVVTEIIGNIYDNPELLNG